MFDEAVRIRFERVAAPVARGLSRRRVTPTAVTAAAFAVAIAAATLVAAGFPRLGVAVWLLSRVGDGLDGVLARVSRQRTAFGGYLDITLDMTAYSAMVLGFAILHPEYGLVWSAVLAGYVIAITSTLALAAAAEREQRALTTTNRGYQFTPGLAEAGETSCVYALWALLPSMIAPAGWAWCAVLVATGILRSHVAWGALRGHAES